MALYFLRRAEFFFQQGDLEQALCMYQQTVTLSHEWQDEINEYSITSQSPDIVPRICIVTPVFNGEAYIDETIYSIVTQAGHFYIRYHIQDGQSSDTTLDKVKAWQRRLQDNQMPLLCKGIEFTFACASDRGMYDAINQAVANINLEDHDYMTWINADDRLAPGALAAVADIFTTFDRIHWLGGRASLINDQGITTHLHSPAPFSQRAIAAGLHDGRKLPFIMQEGTFWRGWLWRKVNGVRDSLKLAGDYDLWKRFAQDTNYVLVDTVLATHRRRPGQLSGAMESYHAEVDTVLSEVGLDLYEETWETFSHPSEIERDQARQDFSGRVLRYDNKLQSWRYSRFSYIQHLNPSIVVSANETQTAIPASFGKGFGVIESGNPIKHLPDGIRWTLARNSELGFDIKLPGHYEIQLICQIFDPISVSFIRDDQIISFKDLPITNHDCTCKITANIVFPTGQNTVQLRVIYKHNPRAGRMLVFSCEAIFKLPSRVGSDG